MRLEVGEPLATAWTVIDCAEPKVTEPRAVPDEEK
jgi:hypothetical protein